MSSPTLEAAGPAISEVYARANRVNAKLASDTSAELVREGRQIATQLIEHVKSKIADFEDFKRRVAVSEEYSLTESRQVPKTEREQRVLYLRATSLLEACDEAEERARRKSAQR